jgi:hypothetical protein
MVDSGLEFEDHAAVADGLGLENYVPLTATVDIGDRVTGMQCLDGHQFRGSVWLHAKHSKAIQLTREHPTRRWNVEAESVNGRLSDDGQPRALS